MQIKVLKVSGMNCNNCALGIKKQLQNMGVHGADVFFATGEVVFEKTSEDQEHMVRSRIESMGYHVASEEKEDVKKSFEFDVVKKFWLSLIFTLPLLSAMFIPLDFLHNPWFQLGLTLPVYFIGLWHFGRSAWSSLKSRIPNMDVLVILGSSAAFFYSLTGAILQLGHGFLFFETTASIITLILLGNMLEHLAVHRTTSSVDELVKLQRTMAHRIRVRHDGTELIEEVESEDILKGDLLQINSGDKVPVDGEIVQGEASLDESMISGESFPVDKGVGERIVGGTILLSGSVRLRATEVGQETLLSKIIEMVKRAQEDKPQIQNLADKISAIFVPVVVGISILTFVLSYWAAGIPLQDAVLHSIAVLVIACPCALGLAIPTAVVVAVGRVARNGILIKGAATIQRLLGVRYIAFDKTGTLTDGRFRISNWILNGEKKELISSVIHGLEIHSAHPVARSLTETLSDFRPLDFTAIKEDKGLGIQGKDDSGINWQFGSFRICPQGAPVGHDLYLLREGVFCAAIDLEDRMKDDAAATIAYFREKGLIPVLISGDRQDKCQRLAKEIGIEKIYAEKRPEEKLEIIRELEKDGGVAMVGDGVNDAPALAQAAVGISLSHATAVAIESAQVILLKGKLSLLTRAYGISKVTMGVIKQNLFWAFFYNIIAIPIAAAGFLDPMIAAASMALSDVIVVLNSLRLRTRKIQ